MTTLTAARYPKLPTRPVSRVLESGSTAAGTGREKDRSAPATGIDEPQSYLIAIGFRRLHGGPMRRFLPIVVLAIAALPAAAGAQSFPLRDLLTDFLREGITLAPPPAGFPSHEAHFIAEDSPQFLAMQQFNGLIANQL